MRADDVDDHLVLFSKLPVPGAFLAQTPTATGFNLKVTSEFWIPPGGGKGVLTLALPELKAQKKQLVTFKTDDNVTADELAVATVTTNLHFKK
jgi:hypothetical protein